MLYASCCYMLLFIVYERILKPIIFLLQIGISKIQWDPTGQTVATCALDSTVKLWVPSAGKLVNYCILQHASAVMVACFCPLPGKGETPKQLLGM